MRVFAAILIVLISIVVVLRIRAGKRRDADLAAQQAANATAKNQARETNAK